MEAVGGQVIVAILPAISLVIFMIYHFKENIIRITHRVFGDPNNVRADPIQRHPRYGGGECSICLTQPKVYEVSITCGHSFCARCLLMLDQRNRNMGKLICPLCRRQVTTIFKSFRIEQERDANSEERTQIEQQIHRYNDRFDDNRPWIRRIAEFPYVLRRVRYIITRPAFIVLFIRSIYFLRALLFVIFYLLLPFDILPERFLGFMGLLDDILIGFFVLTFAATLFALIYLRNRR